VLGFVSGCGLQQMAEPPRIPRVGYLANDGQEVAGGNREAFREGLRDAGWIEGQNVIIDYRSVGDRPERLPDLAAELVALKPDALVAITTPTALAFRRATESIPIVLAAVSDPVASGLIVS